MSEPPGFWAQDTGIQCVNIRLPSLMLILCVVAAHAEHRSVLVHHPGEVQAHDWALAQATASALFHLSSLPWMATCASHTVDNHRLRLLPATYKEVMASQECGVASFS